MAQIIFELEDNLVPLFEQFLAQQQLSKNNWLKELIQKPTNGDWLNEMKNSASLWEDFPMAEELRQHLGKDIPRESL